MATKGARWRSTNASRFVLPIAALFLFAACGKESDRPQQPLPSNFTYAERLGWLHGRCLAIAKADLEAGTSVALVITSSPQKIQQAKIAKPTQSAAECPALMPGRAAVNAKSGMFFYGIEGATLDPAEMGIGILTPPTVPTIANGVAQADLDRDGRSEAFASCATTEGIQFSVWRDKAYQGTPLWSAYYYLDYESKPNCP
jgi:hypothetical protein